MKKNKSKMVRKERSEQRILMKEQATLLYEGRTKWVERTGSTKALWQGTALRKERSPVWLVQ